MFLEKIDTLKVSYVTTSFKIHAIKSFKKVYTKQTQATQLGIPARLTAVALTEISDVSTVAKTLVESSMMSSRILTPRGASIVVYRTTHNAGTGTLVPNKSVALSASACQVSLH